MDGQRGRRCRWRSTNGRRRYDELRRGGDLRSDGLTDTTRVDVTLKAEEAQNRSVKRLRRYRRQPDSRASVLNDTRDDVQTARGAPRFGGVRRGILGGDYISAKRVQARDSSMSRPTRRSA